MTYTPEKLTAIRLAVAKELGIEQFDAHLWDERDDRRYFICARCRLEIGWGDYSEGKGIAKDKCSGSELNWPEDLNACHEMEDSLIGAVGWVHYSQVLLKGNIHAAALQRCEAFLKVKGAERGSVIKP